MPNDPSSQPTPPRVMDGSEDGTILRPGTPHQATPHQTPEDATVLRPAPAPGPTLDEGDRTTYRPRPAPPLADETVDTTHLATPGERSIPSSLPPLAQVSDIPYHHRGRPSFRPVEPLFEAPPEVVVKERAKLPLKGILAWTLALVLIAVSAGVIYVRFFRETQDDPATKLPDNPNSQKVKVLRGDEVVRQYLTALAAGDPDTALALAQSTGTGSSKLITKQAYAASLKQAPITQVQVPEAPENATEIPASYTLGKDVVRTTFKVVKQDNGSWLLNRATVTFRPIGTGVDQVPLLVNGVPMTWGNAMELLPGRYQMSTGLAWLAYPANNTLTVPHLNYGTTTDHQITPVLTPAGKQAFLQAAQRSLQLCLSRRELSPANCPQSVEASPDLIPGSPQWSQEYDTLGSSNPALSATDQSIAQVTVTLHLRLRTQYRGGGTTPAQPIALNTTVSGRVTGSNPDEISLDWRIN